MTAVGIDAIEIDRLRQVMASHPDRFLERVYTAAEQELAAAAADRATFLAGRFAAKEAVLKALGTGWSGGIRFTDVEVLKEPSGAPVTRLHGLARSRADELGASRVLVSITHTRRDAMAVALLID